VNEISKLRLQYDDVRKCWIVGNATIKPFESRPRLRKEWVIYRPVGKLGPAIGIASRPGRLEVRAHFELELMKSRSLFLAGQSRLMTKILLLTKRGGGRW
jgi:hypothetical protein